MTVFQSITEIIICFFAVLGLHFAVSCIFDSISFRKAPSKTYLFIEQCDTKNLEYLIRLYESRINSGEFDDMICGIMLPQNIGLDDETSSKLCREFENIYFV